MEPGVVVVGALAGYNIAQNRVVADWAYVPVNLAMAAGLVGFARGSGMSAESLGLDPGHLRKGLRVGVASGAAIAVAALGAASTGRFDRWLMDERARGHGNAEASYRVIIRFPLGTALFEEVAFRGVLQALWRNRVGAGSARGVTAVAFGAWHLLPTYLQFDEMGATGSTPPSPVERGSAAVAGAVVTGLSSYFFSALRERSDSVAAPWLAHATINSVFYLAARRAWSRVAEGAR